MQETTYMPRYPEERDRFRGEYIAHDGRRILAHGKDAREVLREARKHAAEPVLQQVIDWEHWIG
jgi:hypothetical protein